MSGSEVLLFLFFASSFLVVVDAGAYIFQPSYNLGIVSIFNVAFWSAAATYFVVNGLPVAV